MARNEQEIRRIEGQLLVAKQICRENLKEISRLKKQQENDEILQETNRLLSLKFLNSDEHAEQFNKLLRSVYEQEKRQISTLDVTIQGKKNEENNALIVDLSSNVAELESLFDYAKSLFTQPITSVNMLDNTVSLQEMADDPLNHTAHGQCPIEINNLQERIDTMHKRLTNSDQCDDCLIQ